MSRKLIDQNGNVDALTDRELIAAQSAVIKIREKQFAEQAKAAAKIEEMREREKIRAEREERRAKTIREAREARIEHQRTLEVERRSGRGEALEAREARAKRDVGRLAEMERRARGLPPDDGDNQSNDDQDENNQADREDFTTWDPVETLAIITDGYFLGGGEAKIFEPPEILMPAGMKIVDDNTRLAVACDHPRIREKLECGRGYHFVLRTHPQMVEASRPVWFGDASTRCVILSLPIEGENDGGS